MKNEEELIPELFSKKKKRLKKRSTGEHRDGWETLGERGIVRIEADLSGGISGARTGTISSKALPRKARRILSIGRAVKKRIIKPKYDGDGDNRITNPLTGEDDLPYYNPPSKENIKLPEQIFIPPLSQNPLTIEQRKVILQAMEAQLQSVANGGVDSVEIDVADKQLQTQIRGRFYYWSRTSQRQIHTSINGDTVRVWASDFLSGRNIKISGNMSFTPPRNETPYIGDAKLIEHQATQTKQFLKWVEESKWNEFHQNHYDWWTFPIDKGASHYGFMYDVSGEPLERLKQNTEYLSSLNDAASAYLLSLGWDMKSGLWVPNPDTKRGQTVRGNINNQRLFKIGRSLQIHGLDESFQSVTSFVKKLRDDGIKIHNQNYWDNPDSYTPRSRFKNNNSISGNMRSSSYSPTAFPAGMADLNPDTDTKFRELWDGRDERNAIGDTSKGDLTFDWKDDNARRNYIRAIWEAKIKPGFATFGNKISRGKKHSDSDKKGLSPALESVLNLIADLGVHWGERTGNGYPAFRDQYNTLFSHSLTPKVPDFAYNNQVGDMLGLFAPTINPTYYWTRFEAWLRNPFSVMKNEKGEEVGVRLYFQNDRTQLINEFNKRIARLHAAIAVEYGLKPTDKPFIPLKKHENIETYSISSVPEYLRKRIDSLINTETLPMHQPEFSSTIEALRKELIEYLSSVNPNAAAAIQEITPNWFRRYMQENHAKYLEMRSKKNPTFLRSLELDSLEADQRRDIVTLMGLIKDSDDRDKDTSYLKSVYFPEPHFTEGMINEQRSISGNMATSVGKPIAAKKQTFLLVPGTNGQRVPRDVFRKLIMDINQLHGEGFATRDIALKLNVSDKTVARLVRRLRKVNELNTQPSEKDRVLMYARAGYDASYIRTSLGSSSKLSTNDIMEIVSSSGDVPNFQRGLRGVNRLPEKAYAAEGLFGVSGVAKSKNPTVSGNMSSGNMSSNNPKNKLNKLTFNGKTWKDKKNSMVGEDVWPFYTQVGQYPTDGPPGVSYFKGEDDRLRQFRWWVDCLLYRDENGKLIGILNHYPFNIKFPDDPPGVYEKRGNINIFIDPRNKKSGVATALLREAIARYNVDLNKQRYSAEGAAFVNAFVRKLEENKGKTGVDK